MTIKNIFVPTLGPISSGAALETSVLLARQFGAHADVLFIKEYLHHVLPVMEEGLAPSVAVVCCFGSISLIVPSFLSPESTDEMYSQLQSLSSK